MVTWAGGSKGSELSRQNVRRTPKMLILFEHSEFALYAIQRELEAYAGRSAQPIKIVAVLGSVRNPDRLFDVMDAWKVDTVYHAAARSAERREGKECGSTCRSRWWPYHYKNKKI